MHGYTEKIKGIAFNLLKEKKVEGVIGYCQGSRPMINEPFLATSSKQVEKLVWDNHCTMNLSTYLIDRKEKLGVIAKGCDSRNIVNHIIEGKIQRDQLVIIGVPCQGMVDRRLVAKLYDDEITTVNVVDSKVIVTGKMGTKELLKQDVLQDNCKTCCHHNPVIHDVLVADKVEEAEGTDSFDDVREVEVMSVIEKRAHFEEMLSSCVRCYACRNACPLCYCSTCFVDESRPQWVGKSNDFTDTMTFHLLRAFHCAGRCTDCGACEQACPQDIKMRTLTRKLTKDCQEFYEWKSGLTLEQRSPLDTFKINDPNDFFK